MPEASPPVESDPYIPPSAPVEIPLGSDVEADRSEHLGHEVQLRSVGAVHWLGAGLVVLLAMLTLGIETQVGTARISQFAIIAIAVMLVCAVLLVVLGWGYRNFAPWVRWAGTAASALGLLVFPLGTFIGLWILTLVWCAKGRRVLAPGYADIRRRTPHLQYRPTFGDRVASVVVVSVMLVLLGVFLVYWLASNGVV